MVGVPLDAADFRTIEEEMLFPQAFSCTIEDAEMGPGFFPVGWLPISYQRGPKPS